MSKKEVVNTEVTAKYIEANYIQNEFIGRVVSYVKQPTTTQEFHIGFLAGHNLELGEVVGIVDFGTESMIYGIVDEIFMYEDVPEYGQKMMECNWDFSEDSAIQRPVLAYARINLLRRFSENKSYDYALLGILPNLPVYKVGDVGLRQAFDLDRDGVPVGIYALSSGQIVPDAVIRIDPRYLLGKEAAHVNIAGQSGFGKSAYMLYLLKAIYAALPDVRIKTLIFNVKEDDLLWLDKENEELTKEDLELYAMLGVPAEPFKRVAIYATEEYDKDTHKHPTASLRRDAVEVFNWGWADVRDYIQFAIGPQEDWDDKQEQALNIVRNQERIQSFERVLDYAQQAEEGAFQSPVHTASWGKFRRIMSGIRLANQGLLRSSQPIPYQDVFQENDILIIDINETFFPEYTQRLIFGKIVEDLEKIHQRGDLNADFLLIITDELSRYASKSADRHLIKIREIIKGIAARGRSIKIPLIGIEQFPSEIEEKILGNVNTKVFSRTKQSELKSSLYNQYSKRAKFEMINLKKGYVFVENSQFPDLIKVRYPRPPCAQKFEEPEEEESSSSTQKKSKDHSSGSPISDAEGLM